MSDLAFNNYCISCDQLCTHTSIYCSEECKKSDLEHTIIPKSEGCTTPLVSPLLAPSYEENKEYSLGSTDVDYFDLNYSVESVEESVESTSNNYRRWLISNSERAKMSIV